MNEKKIGGIANRDCRSYNAYNQMVLICGVEDTAGTSAQGTCDLLQLQRSALDELTYQRGIAAYEEIKMDFAILYQGYLFTFSQTNELKAQGGLWFQMR